MRGSETPTTSAGAVVTRRGLARAAGLAGLLLFVEAGGGAAGAASIRPGAVEIGVSGSLTTVEGITEGSGSLRCGYFWRAPGGLVSTEGGPSYLHRGTLDEVEIEGAIHWLTRWRDTSSYPSVGVSAGVRHRELGSFGHSRYPVGASLGWRWLLGERAAFRLEYRLRRLLNDPVKNYSEQELRVGLSVFFRNGQVAPRPAEEAP